MDSIIPQDPMRNKGNDKYTEADKEHNKNGRRNKYNNYRDGRNNFEVKQKQSDNKHHKYPWCYNLKTLECASKEKLCIRVKYKRTQ